MPGSVTSAAALMVSQGKSLEIEDVNLVLNEGADFVQIRLGDDGIVTLLAGKPEMVRLLEIAGNPVKLR